MLKCVCFPGWHGIMINTTLDLTNKYPDISSTFLDKFHFKLWAKSHGSSLNAILCEKGKILTNITGLRN